MLMRQAVLVTTCRTPFVKSFGALWKTDTIGLASCAVEGLLTKTKINPANLDHIIWGNVVYQTSAPNVAREIILDLNLPRHISAHGTTMQCISSLNSVTQACMLIEAGHFDTIIAGGSDSVSNSEMPAPRKFAYGLQQFVYGKKKGAGAIPEFFKEAGYNPKGWVPVAPAVAERSTGKTMGWHADMMADIHKVPRAEQDA